MADSLAVESRWPRRVAELPLCLVGKGKRHLEEGFESRILSHFEGRILPSDVAATVLGIARDAAFASITLEANNSCYEF